MKGKIVCGLMTVGALLAFAGAVSATPITVPLSSFVIFSGGGVQIQGGDETSIGGHTSITGNIGSNQDLFMQGNPETNFPALLMGGAYAGGSLTFGQDLTVGSPSALQQVVVNGTATINGGVTINGTLNALIASVNGTATVTGGTTTGAGANTFALIAMPTATVITAGITPIAANGQTLAPGSYGNLTAAASKTITLTSGVYNFSSINASGGFTLQIDLSSGNPIYIYVAGDMSFGQNNTMLVKGPVGGFVLVKDAPNLASLIYMETNAEFTMGGNNQSGVPHPQNIWGGTLYASDINLLDADSNANGDIGVGQYMNWTGAAYAFDKFDAADHGTWTLAPFTTRVPEPASLLLLGAGLVGLARYGRKHLWKK